MPTSHPESRKWAAQQFVSVAPKTVLDVGVGEGTYSRLLRSDEHWTGIEAWWPYVTQYRLETLYDRLIVDDFRNVSVAADLAIVGDCLEHVSHDEGEAYIRRLMGEVDAIMLILPLGEYPQGEVDGNPFQAHRATWFDAEVRALFGEGLRAGFVGNVVGGYLWRR